MLSRALLSTLDIKNTGASGPPSLASANGQRAREYTAEEWEEQRERFTDLYQTQRLPLAKCQKMMKEKYRFDATERQYKRRIKMWNLERNIKTSEGQIMVSIEARRKHEEGKKTKFTVNGREVSEAKFARIRRKLIKSILFNPSIRTPANIAYYTPRDHPEQPQQRLSRELSRHSHLIECFLCHVTTHGSEHGIMQAFQAHIRSTHPGYDVLRCLEGFEAATQLPGVVRTTRQLPSNHCGYVHGIQTQRNGEVNTFVTVNLGRLCHVEDEAGRTRPYLQLTHAESRLTLRAEPKSDANHEMLNPPVQLSTQDMPFSALEGQGNFEMTGVSFGEFLDEPDVYFNQLHIPVADVNYFLEDWNWDEELKGAWKTDGLF